MSLIFKKTRVFGLSIGEETMTLTLFVVIQYQSVTDGHTYTRTDISPVAIAVIA